MQTLSSQLSHQPKTGGRTALLSAGIAGLLLLFQLLFNLLDSYGIFRDEFYYLAAARRLAWGYVDQPPLSIFLLKLQTVLLGDSLFALRVLPALALAGTVFLSGRMAGLLGGGVWAVVLACAAVATAPIYLAMGSYYSMNSIDIFLWSAAAFLLLLICRNPTPRRWLLLGLVLGLGLLNKVGVLWLGAGLLAGLLLTDLRRQLLTPWPYLAAGIAFAFFLPFVGWNIRHDFAHLEFMQNAMALKYDGISRFDFIAGFFLMLNPLALLLWLPGLYFFLWSRQGHNYRSLGIIFLTVFLILLINGSSKPEYLAPAFPVMLAGGAVFLEEKFSQGHRRWAIFSVLALLLLCAALLAPVFRPILPVGSFVRYSRALGISLSSSEGKEQKELHQFYADRFGWKEMAAKASGIYTTLPASEQAHTYVYTQNYGEAGALEYYQGQYPLPPVLSGHNAYWHWGGGVDAEQYTFIIIGGDKRDHQKAFADVAEVAVHQSRYAMPYEDKLPLYLCRSPKLPLASRWPHVKHFD